MTLDEMKEILINDFGVSEETIDFATDTYGYNQKTFEDILYWKTGYESFDQLDDDEEENDDEEV